MGVVASMRMVCLAAAFAGAASGFALADDVDDDGELRHQGAERASRGAETGEFVPLASIVAAVRGKYAGEIVETEFETSGGPPYYEFHILAVDGRVTEVRVDARSGRFLAKAADDD
jgi:uncharacterized membrane protein YkoI